MENRKIAEDEMLETISGGSGWETSELADFIRTVDPGFTIKSDTSLIRWLENRGGLQFKSVLINRGDAVNNKYILKDGRQLTQAELMKILRETFKTE